MDFLGGPIYARVSTSLGGTSEPMLVGVIGMYHKINMTAGDAVGESVLKITGSDFDNSFERDGYSCVFVDDRFDRNGPDARVATSLAIVAFPYDEADTIEGGSEIVCLTPEWPYPSINTRFFLQRYGVDLALAKCEGSCRDKNPSEYNGEDISSPKVSEEATAAGGRRETKAGWKEGKEMNDAEWKDAERGAWEGEEEVQVDAKGGFSKRRLVANAKVADWAKTATTPPELRGWQEAAQYKPQTVGITAPVFSFSESWTKVERKSDMLTTGEVLVVVGFGFR